MSSSSFQNYETKNILLLFLLLDKSPLGRYKLSRLIGTSKAKTRALLEFLNEQGLAKSQKGRGGTRLTKKGKQLANKIKEITYLDIEGDLVTITNNLIPSNKVHSIMLVKLEKFESTGLYERDLAVRSGADGAVTLVKNQQDNWLFPGPEKIVVNSFRVVNDRIVADYNLAIIGFGKNIGSACSGTAAAVSYHIEDQIHSLIEEQN